MAVSPERTAAVIDFFANAPSGASFFDLADAMQWGKDYARFVCNTLRREGFLVPLGKAPAKTRPRTLFGINEAPVGTWTRPTEAPAKVAA